MSKYRQRKRKWSVPTDSRPQAFSNPTQPIPIQLPGIKNETRFLVRLNEHHTPFPTKKIKWKTRKQTPILQTSFQIGKLKKRISISVAKITPPSTLCITIFLCKYLKLSSLTFNLRSKIINFPKNPLNTLFFATNPSPPASSNFSHGNGCLLENSNRKKQLPLKPDRMSPTPMLHIGQAASPRQRVALCSAGEAKARRSMQRKPEMVRTMPREVAMQTVSKVPLETPRRMKFLCEQDFSKM